MSSLVQEIRDQLQAQILALLPGWKNSAYQYDVTRNSEATHTKLLACRPGAASTVAGTNKTVTLDQAFVVELTDRFNKQGNDSDRPEDKAIMALYENHEKLYRAIHRRNLSIQRVLVVSFLDMGEPVIDNENGTVSIIATYTVKYRTE